MPSQELCTLAGDGCSVSKGGDKQIAQLVVSTCFNMFQHVSTCFNLSSQWNCPMEHLGKALLKPFKDSIGFMPRFKCLNHLGRISTVKLAGEMIIRCAEKCSGDVRVTSSKHLNRQSPWTLDARIVNF
jgi:hypothetical protein